MLLHVVETALPVDDASHRFSFGGAPDNVGNLLALVHDLEQRAVAQPAAVRRLAARLRVERGAVEINPEAFRRRFYPDDPRFKFAQGAIHVIETLSFRHKSSRLLLRG